MKLPLTLPPPVRPPAPAVRRFVLANGLPVHLVERHAVPIVDVALVVRAGADHDDGRTAGRARLAGELLLEGTTLRSGRAFAEAVDLLGAALDVQVAWDRSSLGLHVLAPRLGAALALLHEALTQPRYAPADFERKRRERLAALLQERSEPRALAAFHFARGLYGAVHPYGQPLAGTTRSIPALSVADVAQFHEKYYRPGSAFLVAVGDVTESRLRDLLEETVGRWDGSPAPAAPVPAAATTPLSPLVLVDRPGAPQTELRIGQVAAPRATPDYFALLVLNAVLGGTFTSRINIRLREEKGYTYGAGSNFLFRRGPGPFSVSTAVHGAATADAIADVWRELDRIREEVVPEPELERARRYLTLGLARELETTSAVADQLAEQVLYGLGDSYFEQYVGRVEAVDAAAVQAAARRWLDVAGRLTVAVGDRATLEPALAALGPVTIAAGLEP
jgi:zinc protease